MRNIPPTLYSILFTLSIYDASLLSYFIGLDKQSPVGEVSSSSLTYKFELENVNSFSLVVFLVGAEINHQLLLDDHFPGIFINGSSPVLLNYFSDDSKIIFSKDGNISKVNSPGILLGYTTKTIPRPNKDVPTRSNWKNIFTHTGDALLGINLVSSDNKIRSLI